MAQRMAGLNQTVREHPSKSWAPKLRAKGEQSAETHSKWQSPDRPHLAVLPTTSPAAPLALIAAKTSSQPMPISRCIAIDINSDTPTVTSPPPNGPMPTFESSNPGTPLALSVGNNHFPHSIERAYKRSSLVEQQFFPTV